jgi:hypothetical protein
LHLHDLVTMAWNFEGMFNLKYARKTLKASIAFAAERGYEGSRFCCLAASIIIDDIEPFSCSSSSDRPRIVSSSSRRAFQTLSRRQPLVGRVMHFGWCGPLGFIIWCSD